MIWLLVTAGVAVTLGLARAARHVGPRGRAKALRHATRTLPSGVRVPLTRALARADLAITPEEAVRTLGVAIVVVGLLATALAPVLALPAAGATIVLAAAGLRLAQGRGDRRVAAAVPGGLDRVAAGLRSGGTVLDAVGHLASDAGPLAPDLGRVAARTRLGARTLDALAQWSVERPLPTVRAATGGLAIAVDVGGPAADALEHLAGSLRAGAASVADAHALSAQARVSAVVVGAAPLGYLAFATAADPASLGVLLGTNAGRLCLVGGIALELLAALWIRSLLRRAA